MNIITLCFTSFVRFFSNDYLTILVSLLSIGLGFTLALLSTNKFILMQIIILCACFGFKVGPQISNLGIVVDSNTSVINYFGYYDNISTYYHFMIGLYAGYFSRSEDLGCKLILLPLTLLFFIFRFMGYADDYYISLYQEVSDFMFVLFVVLIFVQFVIYKNNFAVSLSCRDFYFIFVCLTVIELLTSFIPKPWDSYRGALTGFFLASEQMLSLYILICSIHIYLYFKYKNIFFTLCGLAIYYTYSKTALIIYLFVPIIIHIYAYYFIGVVKPFLLSLLIISSLYIYSGYSGDPDFFTIAARMLSLTSPLDAFENRYLFGVGPSFSGGHQISAMNINIFNHDIFKYFIDLNNNEIINSTTEHIRFLKDYTTLPPVGPHVLFFQLVYSMGLLGIFFAITIYCYIPYNMYTLNSNDLDSIFIKTSTLILIVHSLLHPNNILLFMLMNMIYTLKSKRFN